MFSLKYRGSSVIMVVNVARGWVCILLAFRYLFIKSYWTIGGIR